MSDVIVFGPTGMVGSVVAQTAHAHGARVWLAMRDTNKGIPGIDAEAEKTGKFERLYADLTKPDSVAAAVKTSGAKRAFIYLAHSADHMSSTLEAMKSAGVEFVVFLSSYTVAGKLDQISPSELISYVHARVEMGLDQVFGPGNYVALRPGGFASNLLRHKDDIKSGNVRVFEPEKTQFDCITSADMGGVGGVILAEGPRNGQEKVYLYGPRVWLQGDAIKEIGRILGRSVQVTPVGEEEALEMYASGGIPKPFAEYMVRKSKQGSESFKRPNYETGVENVQLYTGRAATGLEEWVSANKQLFID